MENPDDYQPSNTNGRVSLSISYDYQLLGDADHDPGNIALIVHDGVETVSSLSCDESGTRARNTCKSYFYGQLTNVIKSAIWWSTIGLLVTQIIDTPYGIAISRTAFNVGVISCTFFSGLVAEVFVNFHFY